MAKQYEDSPKDIREDKRGAKKMGVSMKAYEKTAQDRSEDKRGQAQLDEAQDFCEGGFVLPHVKAKREGR